MARGVVERMRTTIAMVLVGGLACGPAVGDEESTGDAGGDGSSGAMETSASSAGEVSTTEGSSSGAIDGSTSEGSESSGESGTGASPCDADCESLDERACHECEACLRILGSPWQTDPQGQPCLGPDVYLGCQTGTCAGPTTWCYGGTTYEIDFLCGGDFATFVPCETPDDTYPHCP
jgi:hypothetical protein